jgi:hypothetical protein
MATLTSLIHELAGLLGVMVWPSLALFVILYYRKWIAEFLPVLTEKVRTADTFEVGGLKLTKAKDLVEAAINQPETKIAADRSVPQEQVKNAETLHAQLRSAGVDQTTVLASVEAQIIRFSAEYESIRSFMPAGPQRTSEMNRIMGGLRTLGIAAKPLLPRLIISDRPGDRLAAIALLQTEPDLNYLNWLIARFWIERPFVFFHAALALRQAALTTPFADAQRLHDGIKSALAKVEAFKDGTPDHDTISVLTDALGIIEKKEPK